MKWLLAGLALCAAPALAQVSVENAWSRATPPGAKAGAGYMLIRNKASSPDRLVGASTPAAERVETHETVKDGEVLRMREVQGYAIPANGSFELRPGGAHLMLVNLKAPLKIGDSVPVVLKFERAGEVSAQLKVGHQPTSGHSHHKH